LLSVCVVAMVFASAVKSTPRSCSGR
jgi:hypothetical protein